MPVTPDSHRPAAPERFRLFRVDDRLLHGQVSLGWGRHLGRTDYILADGPLSRDPDAAELIRLAVPEGSRLVVLSTADLIEAPGLRTGVDPANSVLLVRGLAEAAQLLRGGIPGPVNLGGLHLRSGAVEILPFLFLTPGDRRLLRGLIDEGHSFFAQELPGYPVIGGREVIRHPAWGGAE